jgi:lipoprotein-releasing system permease protein
MVIAVAAFNIVSTLVMVVKDKQSGHRDPADDRRASRSSILGIFHHPGDVSSALHRYRGSALLAGVLLSQLNLESVVGFFEATFGIKFLGGGCLLHQRPAVRA